MAPPPGRTRRCAAFTLVELLIVVAIIALLLSLLTPSLGKARNLTRVAICGSNLSVTGRAITLYMSETEVDEPWWYTNGHDLPWEGPRPDGYDASGRMVPISWGNPAIALTKDFGSRATVKDDGLAPHTNPQYFLDTAEAFFCPAASYNYEDHYRRNGLQGLPLDSLPYVWGTYQWMYPVNLYHDGTPKPESDHAARDVLMVDFAWYVGLNAWEQYVTPTYWHYRALVLNGAVVRLPDTTKGAWEWLYGPQPEGERRVGYYGIVRELREDVQ